MITKAALPRHRSSDPGHDGSESYGICRQCVAEARADALTVERLAAALTKVLADLDVVMTYGSPWRSGGPSRDVLASAILAALEADVTVTHPEGLPDD